MREQGIEKLVVLWDPAIHSVGVVGHCMKEAAEGKNSWLHPEVCNCALRESLTVHTIGLSFKGNSSRL